MKKQILVAVKRIKKDKPLLCFIYQDKSEKNYEIFDEGEDERYIKKLGFLEQEEKHYLIEKDTSIQSRTESENFRYCIFLMQANFEGARFTKQANFWGVTFSKQANFGGAIFTKQANFERAIFTEQADFWSATFTKQAIFWDATFTEQANFWGATFTEQAHFCDATFTEQADFRYAAFTKEVDFSRATFTKQAYFVGAKFTEQADFFGATFSQHLIDFQQAQFSTSLILNSVKSIHLNLYQTQLDTIYYDTSTTFNAFNDIPSRETFLILKSIALKQHDKIKALEFHTQEYEQHWDKLNWSTNFGDKLILGFEKWASYFGTSVSRSVSRYFGFAGVFYLLMNGFNNDAQTIANFIIPIKIAVNDLLLSNCPMPWDYGLFVFYKIGQIILLYEIIKSFRKYSRSL